jgi:predicted adenylyl cyclase CyaB
MHRITIEVKARCSDPDAVRNTMRSRNARYVGLDRQVDTYFRVDSGRLKLREGTIERFLIHYDRRDGNGPKQSNVILYEVEPDSSLKEILARSLGIRTVVVKQREIYFIGNVKFHIDRVENLGSFVEIEAIDSDGSIGTDRLGAQCRQYIELLGISQDDFITNSYSDMLDSPGAGYDRAIVETGRI